MLPLVPPEITIPTTLPDGLSDGDPLTHAANRVAREPGGESEIPVRDEMALIPGPSPTADAAVGDGREARPRARRLSRGRRRRILACAEYGNEREPGPPNKRANVHHDLLPILLPGHRNGPRRI